MCLDKKAIEKRKKQQTAGAAFQGSILAWLQGASLVSVH
jgi:hypothetical protein